jgi:hypothetical protein
MAARGELKLTPEAQAFVVQAVACFDQPSVVAAAVNKEFGIKITPQAIEKYDPTKRAGRLLALRWRTMFEDARKRFLEKTDEIGISHRAVRLRALNRMADRAELQGNVALAAQLHKQAAEEMGNAYTNRREFTGRDGKDLPAAPPPVTIFALPDNGRS